MMDPREEQRSLRAEPLPIDGDDSILPSRIALLEKEIKGVEDQIAELEKTRKDMIDTRKILVDHAVKTGHMEDNRYKIDVEIVYGNRVADPRKLAELYPKEYSNYLMAIVNHKIRSISSDLEKAKVGVEDSINLGIAGKIFGEGELDKCCIKPEKGRIYRVVKKEGGV